MNQKYCRHHNSIQKVSYILSNKKMKLLYQNTSPAKMEHIQKVLKSQLQEQLLEIVALCHFICCVMSII